MTTVGTVTRRVFQRARAGGLPPTCHRVSTTLVVGLILATCAIILGGLVAYYANQPGFNWPDFGPVVAPAPAPAPAPFVFEHEVGHTFLEESRQGVATLLDADDRAARASAELGVSEAKTAAAFAAAPAPAAK